tara:strand:- start:10120 stop:10791 length:672 start_codon:yes stop_codon:yes gene_type:complete
MPTWFITGTDTEIGKTIFTGLFGNLLNKKNITVTTQKWVQTGNQDYPLDITIHDQLIKSSQTNNDTIQQCRMPYSFKLPASAHLAAKEENKMIDQNKIIQSLRYLEKNFNTVLIEGLGGIYVPLNETLTTLDVLEQLKIHTIIIIPNQIGAINHALLTIEAIANRQIPISGFIINNMNTKTPEQVKQDNPTIIQSLSGITCIGSINNMKQLELSQQFINKELS